MTRVFRDEDTNDASSSFLVVWDAGGSLQWMPGRKECPEGLNRNGITVAPEAAMSSGSSIMSGFVEPAGWQETALAALCYTPGIPCTIQNL